MKRFVKGCSAGLLALCLSLGAFGQDGLRYAKNLAAQITTGTELQKTLGLTEAPTQQKPAPVLVSRPVPLADLEVLPGDRKHTLKSRDSWDLPPFPDVGPPPPEPPPGLTPEQLEKWNQIYRPKEEKVPTAFSDVPTGPEEAPNWRLRPQTSPLRTVARPEDFQIPDPFSAVRFAAGARIFQLSMYGGTTSFEAEEAFAALRHAVDEREALQGFGKDGFIGRVKEEEPPEEPAPTKAFSDVEVVGAARPDLVDPGIQAARRSPAFKDVPTTLVRSSGVIMPKKKVHKFRPEYLVLVAYIPERAVTFELLMDSRLGTLQHLLQMGLAVQRRVREL